MSGKASLLVVAGFSLVFLVVAQNFGGISGRAVDNYVSYQTETVAHNIALSGANIAANEIYRDASWAPSGYPKQFQGGQVTVEVNEVNPTFGIKEIVSTGIFQNKSSQIRITIAPNNFSEFAYYSTYEKDSPGGGDIWWTGKDTVWGPFHTQDKFRVYQHPSFLGKHTSHKGSIVYYTKKSYDAPVITGIYEPGKSIVIPDHAADDLESKVASGGYEFTGHDTVYLNFQRDTLLYKFSYKGTDSVLYLPTAASNGLIFAKNCTVRLKGVVKGQYTLGCTSSTLSTGKGTVWLDDDIVYNKNPLKDHSSTDLFGIVAENYVWITDNYANNHTGGINIQASIFSEKWGFGAANYAGRPVGGDINLLGGIQQNYRQAVGQFDKYGITSGFTKQYRYDSRLEFISPPFYPGTGGFKIVSWFE
jgi:hypothetical protein